MTSSFAQKQNAGDASAPSSASLWHIVAGRPAVVLAPMEGVTDAPMRKLLCAYGCYSLMVTEFLRVSHSAVPDKVLYRHVPELYAGAKAHGDTPVSVQLLGGDAERIAETAQRAVALGAKSIDLNFGCPARTVNRHDGGASLLKYPKRLRAIVTATRQAVGKAIGVSAKLRLGWDQKNDIFETTDMAAQGGADWLTIHARTKIQGYKPPVDWRVVGAVRQRLNLPIIVNGDIFSLDDVKACVLQSGCEHIMLGRGAIGDLGLCHQAQAFLHATFPSAHDLPKAVPSPSNLVPGWYEALSDYAKLLRQQGASDKKIIGRIKQWGHMAQVCGQAPWYAEARRLDSLDAIFELLVQKGVEPDHPGPEYTPTGRSPVHPGVL